jgi:hypothetical protein
LQPTLIVGQRHGNCDVRSVLAAASIVAPLPAVATTSLLSIAFFGYLFCYDFSASRHFVDEKHWLTAIAPFILTVQS